MTTTASTTSIRAASLDDLAVFGRRERLNDPGIALCGSRAAGERGIEFARAAGSFAAELNLPLVSGYAKGVDLAGHVACVEAGGHTIAVLAEGLGRFHLRRELRAVIDPWSEVESHLTAVSEFEHTARWTVWRAMQRNAVICGLGRILVAIDPGDKGGTLDAIKKAVKQQMPVVIGWSKPEIGRQHLDQFVSQERVTIVDSEAALLEAIHVLLELADTSSEPEPEQLALQL